MRHIFAFGSLTLHGMGDADVLQNAFVRYHVVLAKPAQAAHEVHYTASNGFAAGGKSLHSLTRGSTCDQYLPAAVQAHVKPGLPWPESQRIAPLDSEVSTTRTAPASYDVLNEIPQCPGINVVRARSLSLSLNLNARLRCAAGISNILSYFPSPPNPVPASPPSL